MIVDKDILFKIFNHLCYFSYNIVIIIYFYRVYNKLLLLKYKLLIYKTINDEN